LRVRGGKRCRRREVGMAREGVPLIVIQRGTPARARINL